MIIIIIVIIDDNSQHKRIGSRTRTNAQGRRGKLPGPGPPADSREEASTIRCTIEGTLDSESNYEMHIGAYYICVQ